MMKIVAKILMLAALFVASEGAYTVYTSDYQLQVKIGTNEWMDVGLVYCIMEESEGGSDLPEEFVQEAGKIDTGLTDKNTRFFKIAGSEGSQPCYERTKKNNKGQDVKECTDYHIDQDKEGKFRVYDC